MAMRSIPAAQPTPGVAGPPMMLDQPVIAPAAHDGALGAQLGRS